MTLQNKYILKNIHFDVDLVEVFVDVNVLDQECAAKNLENIQNKPGYKPFGDGFEDIGSVSNPL